MNLSFVLNNAYLCKVIILSNKKKKKTIMYSKNLYVISSKQIDFKVQI